MTRAKREFGSVRRRSTGRYQAYYMGPDQATHRAPSTFETKMDAEAWLVGERRLIQNDEWTPAKSRRAKVRRTTEAFGPYAEAWLEHRDIKPSTWSLYRRLLDRFILPVFADVSLRDLTSASVRVWHSEMDPNTPTQRAHAYALLRSIMATAVADEIIQINPCRIRGAGMTRRARRVEPATLDELKILMDALPERYHAFVLIAAWCGLRFGELAELRRGDIDMTRHVLKIRRGVVRIDGAMQVGTPKSEAGIRDVTMPPHIMPAVEKHLTTFVAPRRDALVFSSVGDPNTQLHPNTLYRHWYRARETAGRPDLRVHDLRHTGAVLAAQTGATLAELMARIGHSTPQAALRYQHAANGRDAEIARRLSAMVADQSP